VKLERITAALVNRVIGIYLEHAFGDPILREAHARYFDETLPIEDVVEQFDREEAHLASYTLRLGCQHYPHMKLALWEAYFENEFVFAVDRHDGFSFVEAVPDYQTWLGLKSKNHRIKREIEDAWYREGIPTLRQLKEERLSQSDLMREFSGQHILVVDNDADSTAIVRMILDNAGYKTVWAEGVASVERLLQDASLFPRCGLALVDVVLNDGTGLSVVKLLRANDATQDIPVVLISALQSADVQASDIDAYLRKPYSAEELLDTVHATLHTRYDGHETLVEERRRRHGNGA